MKNVSFLTFFYLLQSSSISTTPFTNITLKGLHYKKPSKMKRRKNPLGENVPMARGIVLKTLVKHPRKPNSANRK